MAIKTCTQLFTGPQSMRTWHAKRCCYYHTHTAHSARENSTRLGRVALVKLPTACFRRTTQRVQQRDRRQQDQGVCRIVLMHFHCKQSWPQANPGRRPCAALLAPTLAPLVWVSTCTRFSARCSLFYFRNPLSILCSFGVPRLNYTRFLATETNHFPVLSLQLVPPYARPNSLSFACGNLTALTGGPVCFA